MRILVTGATGYVGGRLVPRLLEAGHDVCVLVRQAGRVTGRFDEQRVGVIEGDLLVPASLEGKLGGFDAAYYLVHSMMGGAGFDDRDTQAASNFAAAASACPHVIYLGGLMPTDDAGSPHLSSRAATGRVLAERLPGRVTEFRAGPIIGSGSASFEMVRYLTERLPVMVTPRWVSNVVEPIAVRDVLAYLVAALNVQPAGVVEIGAGALTFRDMMQRYAQRRGLSRRWIIAMPLLAPRLAARWVGLVTPIPNRLAVPLVEGVVKPLRADKRKANALFADIQPATYEQALDMALGRVGQNMVETRWSGSLGQRSGYELADQQGLIREVRRMRVDAPCTAVFEVFSGLGGERGWLAWNWAWMLRGLLDKLIGGPGLRRGRRDPDTLLEGEAVDFWRVERIERPNLLRLRAEMKLPGRAWLQFEAVDIGQDRTELTQTALFEPKGLPGFLYWYALYPLHVLIFRDMIRAVARRSVSGRAARTDAA